MRSFNFIVTFVLVTKSLVLICSHYSDELLLPQILFYPCRQQVKLVQFESWLLDIVFVRFLYSQSIFHSKVTLLSGQLFCLVGCDHFFEICHVHVCTEQS